MLKKEFPYYPDSIKQNMTLLLLWDVLSRNWWAILIVMALPIGVYMQYKGFPIRSFTGFLLILGPTVIMSERKEQAWEVYKSLPIPNYKLTRTIWMEGVVIFPLVSIVLSILLTLLREVLLTPTPSTLHADLSWLFFTVVLCLGFSSLIMMLIPYFPKVNAESNNIAHTLAGGLWGLLIPCAIFGPTLLSTNLSEYISSNFALLTACIMFTAFSYSLRHRLLNTAPVKQQKKKVAPTYTQSSLLFWFQFWCRQASIILVVLFFFAVLSVIIYLTERNRDAAFNNKIIMSMIIPGAFIIIPSTMLAWVTEIRSLRALPMTPWQLTFFLLSVPAINITCVLVLIIALHYTAGLFTPLWHFPLVALFCFSFTVILYNATARFGPRAFVVGFPLFFMLFLLLVREAMLWVPIIGLVMIPVLTYQIKQSSAIYQRHEQIIRNR